VAENDVDIARQLAASDAAQVQSAAGAARAARDMSGYLIIRAPFDGVVTARNLHPGAIVGPSTGGGAQPILQLASANKLRLVVAVPEQSLQSVKVGEPLTFTAASAPGKPFSAPVTRMAGAIDPRTRTMMVEADIANPTDGLNAGSFVTVKWPVRRGYETLRAPPTAVANDQQRQFVVKVTNGVATWVDVTTGMSADGALEVFGKLAAGDLVVKRGGDAIHDGAKVKPTLSK
jgi:membrane fusion protein, multidrug efflux system